LNPIQHGKRREFSTRAAEQSHAMHCVRTACIFWFITLMVQCHPLLAAQTLTMQAPVAAEVQSRAEQPQNNADLPDDPSLQKYPEAKAEPQPTGTPVSMESDTQTKQENIYTLTGDVVLTYKSYVLRADKVVYDSESGDATGEGHLWLTGGPDQEDIHASHGTMNLHLQTGRFYDVTGSIGVKQQGNRRVYTSGNPFLFTGKVVDKKGPDEYVVYDGTMTSCQLPHPDWLLASKKVWVDGDQAHAYNSIFHLLRTPIFYMPYVTHPVDTDQRESGFLIPVLGQSSTKGWIIGEQIYWVIDRSTDMTVGTEYYSRRGWAENASFRYRGFGEDVLNVRYAGLLDRGLSQTSGGVTTITNQGGEDATLIARHDFDTQTRAVANVEYLSSYVYRQAFSPNFNQAISSEVTSTIFTTHNVDGLAASLWADRFQSFESTTNGNEVRIFHFPEIDFDATEHRLRKTGLEWSMESSAVGLKRTEGELITPITGTAPTQPFSLLVTFRTPGVVERLDFHPQVSYPIHAGQWLFRPTAGMRDTFYSRSQQPTLDANGLPVQSNNWLNRKDVEAGFEMRPPVIERDFTSAKVESIFKRDLRHTIEADMVYRSVNGISNFNDVLRFDAIDIASNTNEMDYGVTQRLFLRPLRTRPCKQDEKPDPVTGKCGGGTQEWISWYIGQKYFFDPNFGGALTAGRRNVLDTTLDFSGVAFLTGPRDISPAISRVRIRTTAKTDLEWDLDYDTKAGRIAASNVFADFHVGDYFAGLSHARLDAPGETVTSTGTSQVSNFNQIRLLLGYGNLIKRGLSAAANVGYDLGQNSLQYGALQTSYNWDCCGLNIEYRKYQLGSVRNEGEYRFNFTLAGVGTAGNLRHAEQLF